MTLGVCSDHAGFKHKSAMIAFLKRQGYEIVDYGTYSPQRCDYPDFAHNLALGLQKGEIERGIAFCGTGQGTAMTLNRHKGVRAALCWSRTIARLARSHNDANILVMPARFASKCLERAMTKVFLSTPFEQGRHTARIQKIEL